MELAVLGFGDQLEKVVMNESVADHVTAGKHLAVAPIPDVVSKKVSRSASGFLDDKGHRRRFPAVRAREDRGFHFARSNETAEVRDRCRVHPFAASIHELIAHGVEVVTGAAPPNHAGHRALNRLPFGNSDWVVVQECSAASIRMPETVHERVIYHCRERIVSLQDSDAESADRRSHAERESAVDRITQYSVFRHRAFAVAFLGHHMDVRVISREAFQHEIVDRFVCCRYGGGVLFPLLFHSESEERTNDFAGFFCQEVEITSIRKMLVSQCAS
jgi:hypothetical protein